MLFTYFTMTRTRNGYNSLCDPAEKYTVSPCSVEVIVTLLMAVIKFVIFASEQTLSTSPEKGGG